MKLLDKYIQKVSCKLFDSIAYLSQSVTKLSLLNAIVISRNKTSNIVCILSFAFNGMLHVCQCFPLPPSTPHPSLNAAAHCPQSVYFVTIRLQLARTHLSIYFELPVWGPFSVRHSPFAICRFLPRLLCLRFRSRRLLSEFYALCSNFLSQ